MNKVLRKQIFNIAVCAIFTVLAVIAGRLSIYIPVLGFSSTRVSFFSIPVILGSLILGPIYGGIIGGLGDLIGAFSFPVGAYFYGFTIDGILLGVLPGLIVLINKKLKYGNFILLIVLSLILFGLLNHFFINYDTITISNNVIELRVYTKILITLFYLLIFGLGIAVMIYFHKHKKNPIVMNTFISVFANELLVSALLASVWKEQLYSLPYFLNTGIALIYMLINIPLKTIVVSLIYPPVITMINTQKTSLSINENEDDKDSKRL